MGLKQRLDDLDAWAAGKIRGAVPPVARPHAPDVHVPTDWKQTVHDLYWGLPPEFTSKGGTYVFLSSCSSLFLGWVLNNHPVATFIAWLLGLVIVGSIAAWQRWFDERTPLDDIVNTLLGDAVPAADAPLLRVARKGWIVYWRGVKLDLLALEHAARTHTGGDGLTGGFSGSDWKNWEMAEEFIRALRYKAEDWRLSLKEYQGRVYLSENDRHVIARMPFVWAWMRNHRWNLPDVLEKPVTGTEMESIRTGLLNGRLVYGR